MLDRTNIHFKKAVEAILEKIKRNKGYVSLVLDTDYLSICLFKDDSKVFYQDMICNFHTKEEIRQKVDNFNKMYYACRQLKKKGDRHEYIGTDCYNRKMELYHIGNEVYCDHIKNGVVVKTNSITVDNRILGLFGSPHTSGAYIYDEITRVYGKKL